MGNAAQDIIDRHLTRNKVPESILLVFFAGFFRADVCVCEQEFAWRSIHAQIVDAVIAMHSLQPQLSVYEFLFIFDAIPYWQRAQPAYRKVRLIDNLMQSIRNVRDSRRDK